MGRKSVEQLFGRHGDVTVMIKVVERIGRIQVRNCDDVFSELRQHSRTELGVSRFSVEFWKNFRKRNSFFHLINRLPKDLFGRKSCEKIQLSKNI